MEFLEETKKEVSIKWLPAIILLGCILGSASRPVQAYETVLVGTGVPEAVENSFIAAATAQFNITLQKNPLAANTYTETLWGYNPKYNPPTPAFVLIDSQTWQTDFLQMITNSSYTYIYGWSDGSQYTRFQDVTQASYDWNFCTSTAGFSVPPPNFSTSTWKVPKIDSTTCQFVAAYIGNTINGLSFSSPTVIPGNWQ